MEPRADSSKRATKRTVEVFCEDGAISSQLRALQHAERITLVAFPYEKDLNRHIRQRAEPSRLTCAEQYIYCDDTEILCSDGEPSLMYERIREILGREQRHEMDARLIDSAYVTGLHCFLTRDKRTILKHRVRLESLLSIRFFHPDDDEAAFMRWLENQEQEQN